MFSYSDTKLKTISVRFYISAHTRYELIGTIWIISVFDELCIMRVCVSCFTDRRLFPILYKNGFWTEIINTGMPTGLTA